MIEVIKNKNKEASMNKDGGAAFPCPHPSAPNEGMTMRQWYKGMALQGLLASFREGDAVAPDPFSWLSGIAAKYADSMLAEDAAHEGGGDER
jgi:hypothetical protein